LPSALLITNPKALDNPFYRLAPDWAPVSAGGAGNRGNGDRLAGNNLGHVFADQAGDPACLSALWRERLFAAMARHARTAGDYFNIPPGQVIDLKIEI
jgi:K+ transporter